LGSTSPKKTKFNIKMIKKEPIMYIIMVLLVVSLGMLAVNQAFGWYYKLDLLANPCDNCLKYNDQYKDCFKEKSQVLLDSEGNEIKIKKINITDFKP